MYTMKFFKIILSLVFIFSLTFDAKGQESVVMQERSPEQEAAKQTEKLQNELQLTPEQTQIVHEINLKYARERKISNTRTDALRRIKEKDEDLQRVLNHDQFRQLQNKRYNKSSFQQPDNNTNSRTEYKSNENRRTTYPTSRTPSVESSERRSVISGSRNDFNPIGTNSNMRSSDYQRQTQRSTTRTNSSSDNYERPSALRSGNSGNSVPRSAKPTESSSSRSTYSAPRTSENSNASTTNRR